MHSAQTHLVDQEALSMVLHIQILVRLQEWLNVQKNAILHAKCAKIPQLPVVLAALMGTTTLQ